MPANAGYTLRCKSCGASWQFLQSGELVTKKGKQKITHNLTPNEIIAWHNDRCTGLTFNEKCAQSALASLQEEQSELAQ